MIWTVEVSVAIEAMLETMRIKSLFIVFLLNVQMPNF